MLLKEYMIDIDRLVSVKCNVTFPSLSQPPVHKIISDLRIIFYDMNIVLGVIATIRPHNSIVMYVNMQPMILKMSFSFFAEIGHLKSHYLNQFYLTNGIY